MKVRGRVFALDALDSGSTPSTTKTKAIYIFITQCVFVFDESWLSWVQKESTTTSPLAWKHFLYLKDPSLSNIFEWKLL